MEVFRHVVEIMDERLKQAVRVGLIATALLLFGGCRAISRFGESRQSIESRHLSRLGRDAAEQGQWDQAETLFRDALGVSTSDDRAHAGMAESLWQRGERELALGHMEHALRLSADDPKHLLRLGRMYLEVGRLDDADVQSLAALAAERESADAWTLRGDCLSARGKQDEALAAYHRALAMRPDAPGPQLEAAEIYRSQGRYDRLLATIDRLSESVGAEQAPARAELLRGIAMRELGRNAEAGRCFARAAEKAPGDPSPHLHLASLSLDAGEVNAARISLAKALELDPNAIRDPKPADDSVLKRFRAAEARVADDNLPASDDPDFLRR